MARRSLPRYAGSAGEQQRFLARWFRPTGFHPTSGGGPNNDGSTAALPTADVASAVAAAVVCRRRRSIDDANEHATP